MGEKITLEISEEAASRARAVALYTNRRIEEVINDWIHHVAGEIDHLPDEQIAALADLQMSEAEHEELSLLLVSNREGELNTDEISRLDALVDLVERNRILKADAIRIAVARGLRPPLNPIPLHSELV